MTTELECSRDLWREPTYLPTMLYLKPRTWLNLKVNKHTVNKVLVFPVDKEELLIQIKRTNIVKLKSGDHV